jgi:hypothetical protein
MTHAAQGNAVFTSSRQALHVSFMLEVMPAVAKSQMQVVIEQLMKQAGVAEELERHERTIDFRGLTALEVRGQCAMVVGAVNSKLTQPEQAAIWAKYGMRKRQAQGVDLLADYVEPMMTVKYPHARLAMIWGKFGREINREAFSIRKIASEYGLHANTVARDQQKVVTYQRNLEGRALQRLDPYFEETGLIDGGESMQRST